MRLGSNNTRAQISDSIYHKTLRILSNLISAVNNVINFLSVCTQRCYGSHDVFNFFAWRFFFTPRRDVI